MTDTRHRRRPDRRLRAALRALKAYQPAPSTIATAPTVAAYMAASAARRDAR